MSRLTSFGASAPDLARRDAGNAAQQEAPAAHRLLEKVRTCLSGESTGDLTHRREQGQSAIGRLDGLVGDRRDSAFDQRPRELLVGRQVEIGEEDEALAQALVLPRDRLLHLQQQFRLAPGLVDRHDLSADRLVRRVREGAARSRARLDEHVVPLLDELAGPRRRQRDAVLVGLDLLCDADPHLEPGNLRRLSAFEAGLRCYPEGRLHGHAGKAGTAFGSAPQLSHSRYILAAHTRAFGD